MSFGEFPVRFGRYILLDKIASGGMAEVFRAKTSGAEDFQRMLAIKCMRPELTLNKQFLDMFIDEAKLAAQLHHANIVQIYELGNADNRLYIAMELIQGRDLRHILNRATELGQRLSVGFCTYVIAKAADALEHAHTMTSLDGVPLNIIHRDVSPQNILVTYDGEVKLVDFGIARAEQRQGETEAGQIKGKLSYMAPEQILGSAVLDHRVDVFALGAVFYELLTGKQLFTGDLLQVMEKIRSGEVPSVRTTHPDLPEHLDKVVQKCLARRLEDRYASASEVADTLARFLVTEDTLVGSRFAGRLMGTMYREEIAALAQRNSHYLTITEQDCIYGTTPGGTTVIAAAAPSDAARSGPPATDSRVTRTTFLPGPSGSGVTAAPGDTVAISPGAAAASSVRRFPPWAIGAIGASAVLVVCVALVVAMLRPSGGATLAASTPTPAGPAAPSGVAQAAPSADAGGSQTAGGARGRGKRSEHAKTPGGAGGGQAPAANAASATSPPAKGKGGFLSVGHKPPRLAAKVFIDGQDFGYSPLMAVAVSPGRHDVEVAEFQGDAKGRSMRRTVTVTPQNSESKPLVVIITFP